MQKGFEIVLLLTCRDKPTQADDIQTALALALADAVAD